MKSYLKTFLYTHEYGATCRRLKFVNEHDQETHNIQRYSRINYTKSPASDAGNVNKLRLISQVGRLREVTCG